MSRPLKIRMSVTITLDPDDWTAAYDVAGVAAIRADVRRYVGELLPGLGVFGDGEVPADVLVTS